MAKVRILWPEGYAGATGNTVAEGKTYTKIILDPNPKNALGLLLKDDEFEVIEDA